MNLRVAVILLTGVIGVGLIIVFRLPKWLVVIPALLTAVQLFLESRRHSPAKIAPEGQSPTLPPNPPLGGIRNYEKKVLLVEDHPEYQKVHAILLRGLGLEVTLASNGKDALALCHETCFDLILMDMEMPVMNGLKATRSIRRQDGCNTTTPIIALTGHTENVDRDKCFEAGMIGFIQKPARREALIEDLDALFLQG